MEHLSSSAFYTQSAKAFHVSCQPLPILPLQPPSQQTSFRAQALVHLSQSEGEMRAVESLVAPQTPGSQLQLT